MALDYLLLPYKSETMRWDDTVIAPKWFKDDDGNLKRAELRRISNNALVCMIDLQTGGGYFPNGFTGSVVNVNGLIVINLT